MKRALQFSLAVALIAVSAQAVKPKSKAATPAKLPRPDHIVIVFEENKAPGDLSMANAPYLNTVLEPIAATLSLYAFHHPSQPNYYEFFAGTNALDVATLCNDSCPPAQSRTNNLYRSIANTTGVTFTGYAESLPAGMTNAQALTACQTSCPSQPCYQCYFALKHAPWMAFAEVPQTVSLSFASFPTDFTKLPTISLVTPNLLDDMHSPMTSTNCQLGTNNIAAEVTQGDTWLKNNMAAYAMWAMTHNSLLIVTWDESSNEPPNPVDPSIPCPAKSYYGPGQNQIATFVIGQPVKTGYTSTIQYNHHDLLNTIVTMYGMPAVNGSAGANVISDIWK